MRKIVVYELMSLDGVAEDPDAFFADWDDAMDANLASVIATQRARVASTIPLSSIARA